MKGDVRNLSAGNERDFCCVFIANLMVNADLVRRRQRFNWFLRIIKLIILTCLEGTAVRFKNQLFLEQKDIC